MNQSSLNDFQPSKLHAAIIMDGNGRWASARGLPRVAGHKVGAETVRRVVEHAPTLGVGVLTLYAFSSDNWKRPRPEVAALMRLFHEYLQIQAAECAAKGVRVEVIGRRDRLPASVLKAVRTAETVTRDGNTLRLRLAVDYSSRDAILNAASRLAGSACSRDEFGLRLAEACSTSTDTPDVDLLIRTGGEQRLSDFLLWECAYAEFHFTKRMWPEFEKADFEAAVNDFRSRQRRFGEVPKTIAS